MAAFGPSSTSPHELHTYHCLCTNLLFTSTQVLSTLPQRSTLDRSYIVSLQPPPPRESHAAEQLSSYYASLLGTTLERNAIVIRGDGGFEKRYLQQCGRCKLTVGYHLDKSQYEAQELGRRTDVVYLLPGGFMTTEEMADGKGISSDTALDGTKI